MNTAWLALAAVSLLGARAAASPAGGEPLTRAVATDPRHLVTRSIVAMGTQVSVSVYTADDEGATRAIENALDEIARIERMMTTWRDDSEISRLNANAGIAPVHVSPETMEVLEMAQKSSAWSQGAFDVTFQVMHGVWKFDEDMEKHPRLPDPAEIAKLIKLIDWHHLKLDEKKQTAFLERKGMAVGLGGIAKGYAVDRMANILRRAGFNDALVQAGGDLLCAGTKGGKPWTAGIRDPRGGPKEVFAAIQLQDHAFSTAGDYERYFMLDGKRYHHIIDPKTGQPARASRSVTVYAKTAHLADALDDAIFIVGWQAGFDILKKIPDTGAIVVDNEGVVHVSDRVKDRVQILYTPKNQP